MWLWRGEKGTRRRTRIRQETQSEVYWNKRGDIPPKNQERARNRNVQKHLFSLPRLETARWLGYNKCWFSSQQHGAIIWTLLPNLLPLRSAIGYIVVRRGPAAPTDVNRPIATSTFPSEPGLYRTTLSSIRLFTLRRSFAFRGVIIEQSLFHDLLMDKIWRWTKCLAFTNRRIYTINSISSFLYFFYFYLEYKSNISTV